MLIILIVFFFILGLAFGSFINASEFRLFHKIDFLKKRSFCDNCKKDLEIRDLIPFFSLIFNKGKCRYCGTKVSWWYSVIEFVSGLLFVIALFFVKNVLFDHNSSDLFTSYENLSVFLVVSFALAIIFDIFLFVIVYDFRYQIIPDEIILPCSIIALLILLIGGIFNIQNNEIFNLFFYDFNLWLYLLTAIAGGAFFLIIIILTKGKGMGGGDLKLAILMGLFLGPARFIIALYFALISASLFGIGMAIKRGKFFGTKVPFGSFLAMGSIVAVIIIEKVVEIFWF